jgi:thioredoxin-like negative regulator of GroEL
VSASEASAVVGTNAPQETAQPLLLFFHSPTSGPCRRVEGFLALVLQHRQNHDTFRLVRVDVDREPALAERLNVSELPTLMVVADGVRRQVSNPRGRAEIKKLLEPWLK